MSDTKTIHSLIQDIHYLARELSYTDPEIGFRVRLIADDLGKVANSIAEKQNNQEDQYIQTR